MANERQRAEWERTSWQMAWVGRFRGGPFEPDKLNPLADRNRPAAGPPVPPEREAAFGWAALGAGLRETRG